MLLLADRRRASRTSEEAVATLVRAMVAPVRPGDPLVVGLAPGCEQAAAQAEGQVALTLSNRSAMDPVGTVRCRCAFPACSVTSVALR